EETIASDPANHRIELCRGVGIDSKTSRHVRALLTLSHRLSVRRRGRWSLALHSGWRIRKGLLVCVKDALDLSLRVTKVVRRPDPDERPASSLEGCLPQAVALTCHDARVVRRAICLDGEDIPPRVIRVPDREVEPIVTDAVLRGEVQAVLGEPSRDVLLEGV